MRADGHQPVHAIAPGARLVRLTATVTLLAG